MNNDVTPEAKTMLTLTVKLDGDDCWTDLDVADDAPQAVLILALGRLALEAGELFKDDPGSLAKRAAEAIRKCREDIDKEPAKEEKSDG